jgi:hypothetical protein
VFLTCVARCVQPYTEAAAKAKADYDAKYKVVQDKKPKRPLSAYMLFSNSARPKVKAANPTAGNLNPKPYVLLSSPARPKTMDANPTLN